MDPLEFGEHEDHRIVSYYNDPIRKHVTVRNEPVRRVPAHWVAHDQRSLGEKVTMIDIDSVTARYAPSCHLEWGSRASKVPVKQGSGT